MAGGYPCGCCGCIRFSDDFNRDNADDPGSDYTEEAGDWDINANQLVCSDSDSLLTIANAHAEEETSFQVDLTFDQEGDQLQLAVDYEDVDNYWFGQVECGAADPASTGEIKLYERIAGVDNERINLTNQPVRPGDTISVRVCITANHIEINYDATGLMLPWIAWNATAGSSQCALGTGTLTGTATFDNLYIYRHKVNNGECEECIASCGHVCSKAYATDVTVDVGTLTGDETDTFSGLGNLSVAEVGGEIDFNMTVRFSSRATMVLLRAWGFRGGFAGTVNTYLWDNDAVDWEKVDDWDASAKDYELPAKYIDGDRDVKIRWQVDGLGAGRYLQIRALWGCYDGELFEQFEVVIDCDGCAELSGTYILDIFGSPVGGWNDARGWRYTFPATVCVGPFYWVDYIHLTIALDLITVVFRKANHQTMGEWWQANAFPFTCVITDLALATQIADDLNCNNPPVISAVIP